MTAAFKAGMAALNITMTANPVGLIVAAIAGLIAAFVLAYNKVEWFRDGVDKAFAWLKEFVSTAINNIALFFTDTLPQAIDKTVQWFRDLPNNISTYLTTALDNVKTWVSNMVNSSVEMGGNFIASVVQFFNELPYNIGYYTGLAIGSVIQWALDMVDQAKEMGTSFIAGVIEFFTQLPGKVAEFLTQYRGDTKAKESKGQIFKKCLHTYNTSLQPDYHNKRKKSILCNKKQKMKERKNDLQK